MTSIDTLISATEARFSKLTLVQLCKIAHSSGLNKEEFTNVDGVIYRATLINILKRRYIFGIIAALLKHLNSNVFECIAKFFDFDIKWQKRIHEYLSSTCFTYKTLHKNAILQDIIAILNNGRKSHIMTWISKSPNHQLAYYKFKKEQNIEYNKQVAYITERDKEAKLEFKHTRERKKYEESIQTSILIFEDLNAMYDQRENDWIYIYAFINFPVCTKMLFTHPENLLT